METSRLKLFESNYGVSLLHYLGLGPGQDGVVFQTDRLTAVKFFDRSERYTRELEVYRVLRANETKTIVGHNVPQLIREDDLLLALEMTIVRRPFILDFAGAKRRHEVPDFEPHAIQEHYEHLQDLFGARWTEVLQTADAFQKLTGYTLLDLHPGNISFPD